MRSKKTVYAWDQPKQQLFLKKVLVEAELSQRDFGPLIGVSPGTINLCCNRSVFPKRIAEQDFKQRVETALHDNQKAMEFLSEQKKQLKDIWKPYSQEMIRVMPADHAKRCCENPLVGGDPLEIEQKEVFMLHQTTMKHFRLFRNPFINDVQQSSDIYMSEEHRYLCASMHETATNAGLLAVIGEVGSGKSVMRRKIIEDLQHGGKTLVIYPRILEKQRINGSTLADAIILDISSEKPTIRLEAKGRQVHRLLLQRHKEGYRHVLIIEEAHMLDIDALKFLKQLHELEAGYTKMLGIVLIGQPELCEKLSEAEHPELRELIRRIQFAEIKGISGNIKDYLDFKFARLKNNIEKIFSDEALEMMARKMTAEDEAGRRFSTATPLEVNRMAVDAMNLAVEMGEEKVTADVIEAI